MKIVHGRYLLPSFDTLSFHIQTLSQGKLSRVVTLVTGGGPDVNWCQSLSAGDFNAQIGGSPLTNRGVRRRSGSHTLYRAYRHRPITGPSGQGSEEIWGREVILSIRAFVTTETRSASKHLMRIRIIVPMSLAQKKLKMWSKPYLGFH